MTKSTRIFGFLCFAAASSASAQHVVVLEIAGDRGKLRQQVEQALLDGGKVDLIPLRQFLDEAAKQNLAPEQATTSEGIAALAAAVGVDAAVGGSAAQAFHVRIMGADGQELWSRDIPLRRGLMAPDNARRLAKAIGVAAQVKKEERPPPEPEVTPPPVTAAAPPLVEATPVVRAEPRPPSPRPAEPQERHVAAVPAPQPERSEPPVEATPSAEDPGPRRLTVELLGGVTWRSYCSRPGVSTCAQYDSLPVSSRPIGETVTFTPQIPYGGFGIGAEGFPLYFLDNLARGIGVSALYTRSYSLTVVSENAGGSPSAPSQVLSTDQSLIATLLGRYYFRLGSEGLTGYAGIRVGLGLRLFDVDPNSAVQLPGAHRVYPVLGLEASIPILAQLHVDGGFLYFVNPGPGTQELVGYGTAAVAGGFSAELGVSGDIWGPLGYVARFRFERYADRYSGAGSLWTNGAGGAAEESYATLLVGPTAHF